MKAQPLTPDGEKIAGDLALRHGFSVAAVTQMMNAVLHGNGSMAQFSHSEFGGSGQWMRGGMLMLGDMFNHGLKTAWMPFATKSLEFSQTSPAC